MTLTRERPATELQPEALSDERPILTIDMDGVFCSPFFGWNVGISSAFLDPNAAPRLASVPPDWIRVPWDTLRFNPRRPLPDARTALARLHEVRRLVVLTGRRTYPRWWLRRHRLIQRQFIRHVQETGFFRKTRFPADKKLLKMRCLCP